MTSQISRSGPLGTQEMLIGGEWMGAASGEVIETENPTTEAVIGSVPAGGRSDVDRACDAAIEAGEEWAGTPWTERALVLREMAARLRDNCERLARLDAEEAGLPLASMRNDVLNAAHDLDYFAGIGGELKGVTFPTSDQSLAMTVREPYGVVGRIVPFNHPVRFAAGKIAAPLMAGNAVILKPAETSSLSALEFGRIVGDLLPAGALNIVTGRGAEAGAAIAAHPSIPRVAFTGGVAAGREVMRAGAAHIKAVSLELGGKNPLVVCPDANLASAARAAVTGMNLRATAGQSCQSNSRVLVHSSVLDAFLELLVAELSTLQVGDPLNEETDIGPVAFRQHFDRILEHIRRAGDDGARLVMGGGRHPDHDSGLFIAPTVFSDVLPEMSIAQEEVFGPVIAVMAWSSMDQLVKIANGTAFGLTARILTNDQSMAQTFARKVKAGVVWVNDPGALPRGVPFGGYKRSGLGKEGGLAELLSYSQEKSIVSAVARLH